MSALDTIEHAKSFVEMAVLAKKGVGLVALALGVGGVGRAANNWRESTHISKMRASWQTVSDLIARFERDNVPMQTYFPQFFVQCKAELNEVAQRVDELGSLWDGDKRWFKFLSPMKDCVRDAKATLKKLERIQDDLNNSSIEAASLQARNHPVPRDGEILRPRNVEWPGAVNYGAQVPLLPTQHIAYRQAQDLLQAPHADTVASPTTLSPYSSTTSLGHPYNNSFGHAHPQPHIPGGSYAVSPIQLEHSQTAAHRSNTMPVPAQYAHFYQAQAPYSPYGPSVYPPSAPYP